MRRYPRELLTQLKAALRARFRTDEGLQEFLEDSFNDGAELFDQRVGGNIYDRVGSIVGLFGGRDRIPDLLDGLKNFKDGKQFATVIARLRASEMAEFPADDDEYPVYRRNEARIIAGLNFLDPVNWRAKMADREKAVARVEGDSFVATGFLIGPDLVVTNAHVTELFDDRSGRSAISKPANVRVRFEASSVYDALARPADDDGQPCRLASPWWVAGGNYQPGSGDPGADWTIIRLADPPQGITPIPIAAVRKDQNGELLSIQKGEPLLILQYPEGGPLRLAFGGFHKEHPSWFEHTATTDDGSSGSPCFDANLELIGLHKAASFKNLAVHAHVFAPA